MDFIKGLLIVIGIATVASAIIGTIKDCRGTNETHYDPCTFEVGQEIEVTTQTGRATKYVELTIQGCELPVILRIIGIPPQRKPGDAIKYRIVKVNSSLSYDVEVIKPEKDTTEKDTTGSTPPEP